MAVVRPFSAIRYAAEPGSDLSSLTAPPYDVVSADERSALLAKDQHNVAALELAEGPLDADAPGNRYDTAAGRLAAWLDTGILVTDDADSIYVVEQRWTHAGSPVRRRAFIAAVQLERFEDGIVLAHERTLSKALDDRLAITRACAVNFSQVFGLFSDEERVTDTMFDTIMAGDPTAHATDADGVVSTLWRSTDFGLARSLGDLLTPKQVFIADGHHRYTTALAYRDERRAADAAVGVVHDTPPAYDSVMMALVNMDDPDLVVLPYHRIADAPGDFDAEGFWRGLSEHFDVTEPPSGHPAAALAATDTPAFLVRTCDGATRLATLKQDVDVELAIEQPHSRAWKALDVAILQELVLASLLDIHPDRPHTLERLRFVKDPHDALAAAGEHDVSFVLRATRLEQLRAVSLAGETMPQKSTYFYPKLLSGLVIRSLS